jgi:hypothetical protein
MGEETSDIGAELEQATQYRALLVGRSDGEAGEQPIRCPQEPVRPPTGGTPQAHPLSLSELGDLRLKEPRPMPDPAEYTLGFQQRRREPWIGNRRGRFADRREEVAESGADHTPWINHTFSTPARNRDKGTQRRPPDCPGRVQKRLGEVWERDGFRGQHCSRR